MPEKCLPTLEDFEVFEKELFKVGFRRLTGGEFSKQFEMLGLKAPRPRPGRELGYIFYSNEYVVFVWTTWLLREEVAREEDAGWVLIAERGKELYFSHPIHRTKNFLYNLSMQAWIAALRVLGRPLCPECRYYMDIVRGRALKQRYWKCERRKLHPDGKDKFRDWDYGLPEKALEYLRPIRKRRKKRYATLRALGKEPHQAMLKRVKWGKREQ